MIELVFIAGLLVGVSLSVMCFMPWIRLLEKELHLTGKRGW